MVITLYKDGSLLKTSLLDVYNCPCYPIGRTLRPSVECPGGEGHFTLVGPSAECPGGHCALVQNVREGHSARGDNPPSHSGLLYIATVK